MEHAPLVTLNAERFVYERKRRGLEAQALSRLSGVGIVTISRIERGHQQPTIKTLLKLLTALKSTPVRHDLDELLTVADGPDRPERTS